MMQIVSKLLIALGVLGVLLALNMNVSLPGAEVVNIHLISERQNYLFLSVAIFIAGIILFVSARRNERTDTPDISRNVLISDEVTPQGHKSFLMTFWNSKYSSSKFLLIAAVMAGVSTMLDWSSYRLSNSDIFIPIGGSHISYVTLAVMIGCWVFPIYRVVAGLRITKRQLLIPASILTIWMIKEIFSLFRFANSISEVATSAHISIGAGMWLAIASTYIFAWIAATYR